MVIKDTATVGLVSLGCSKNQVDAERLLYALRLEGFELSDTPTSCNAVIVNTCGFIEDAKRESIEQILSLCAQKGEGKLRVVAVTGCLAERYREQIMDEMPEVDVVLGIGSNADLAGALRAALQGQKVQAYADKGALSLEGERVLTTPGYTAYVKVAEGCDNRCSYCAIPGIRGGFRSRSIESVMDEVHALVAGGVREINLVAQDTTRYGDDLYGRLMLPELLRRVAAVDGVRWVRVLYCYPDRISDELLAAIASEPKVVKYMDIPLQHASGAVLRSMNRRGDAASLGALMAKIRGMVPGIVIRTTMIVGYPGESEQDFEQLCGFVRDMRFERLGAFAYSVEEDTPAAAMGHQHDEHTKRARVDALMTLQQSIAEQFGRGCVGRELTILTEGYDTHSGMYYGRSYMDAPDIDTRTFFTADYNPAPAPGDFVNVRISGFEGYDLIGRATGAK